MALHPFSHSSQNPEIHLYNPFLFICVFSLPIKPCQIYFLNIFQIYHFFLSLLTLFLIRVLIISWLDSWSIHTNIFSCPFWSFYFYLFHLLPKVSFAALKFEFVTFLLTTLKWLPNAVRIKMPHFLHGLWASCDWTLIFSLSSSPILHVYLLCSIHSGLLSISLPPHSPCHDGDFTLAISSAWCGFL